MRKLTFVLVAVLSIVTMVAAACSSAPTLAPLPTYTPYPTYTPVPVPTQAAAPAGQPTYTPYPTYTPVPLPTATPVPGTSTPTPKPEVIKIGSSSILSGAGAAWGLAHDNGLKMAADEINAAGGLRAAGKVYMLQVVSEDNGLSAQGGTQAANKLIFTDKVSFIFYAGLAPTLTGQVISEANKIISHAGGYGASALGASKPYSFRAVLGSEQWSPIIWNFARQRWPQAKRVAIITPNDAIGWDLRDYAIAGSASVGGFEIVTNLTYQRGTTDVNPLVTALVKASPDIVDTGAAPPGDNALLIEGLRQMGFTGPITSATAFDWATVAGLVGNGPLQGTITASPDPGAPDLPAKAREFYYTLLLKYGPPFSALTQFGYDGLYAIKAGVEAANSIESDKVLAAWDAPGFKYEGLYGATTFGGKEVYGINRQAYGPAYAAEFVNRTSVIKKIYNAEEVRKLHTDINVAYEGLLKAR